MANSKNIPQWAFKAVSATLGLGAVIMLAIFAYVLDTHTKIAVIETQLTGYEKTVDQVQANKTEIKILRNQIGISHEDSQLDKNDRDKNVRGDYDFNDRVVDVRFLGCVQGR